MYKRQIDGIAIDEFGCDEKSAVKKKFICSSSYSLESIDKDHVCDDVCNCHDCEDEAKCHNLTVGITCIPNYSLPYKSRDASVYVPAWKICDQLKDCEDGEDEKNCGSTTDLPSSCLSTRHFTFNWIRYLSPRSRCSVPSAVVSRRVCDKFEDQLNCSFSTISPLLCRVKGYPTTVSEYMLCTNAHHWNITLCDSGIEKALSLIHI